MSYVETKGRVRQFTKHGCELTSGPADRFPFIHVLDANRFSEFAPQPEIIDGIRVDNNGPAVTDLVPKAAAKGRLPRRFEAARSVDGNIVKIRQIELRNRIQHRNQLGLPQSGQFDYLQSVPTHHVETACKITVGEGACRESDWPH